MLLKAVLLVEVAPVAAEDLSAPTPILLDVLQLLMAAEEDERMVGDMTVEGDRFENAGPLPDVFIRLGSEAPVAATLVLVMRVNDDVLPEAATPAAACGRVGLATVRCTEPPPLADALALYDLFTAPGWEPPLVLLVKIRFWVLDPLGRLSLAVRELVFLGTAALLLVETPVP